MSHKSFVYYGMCVFVYVCLCVSVRACAYVNYYFSFTVFFAGFMAAIAVVQDVVQKGFQDTLILPCRCNNSQSCYSQINNNLTDTGSYITPDGNLFVPAGTWDVQGKVCCGPDSNQSQCWTVCSYNGNNKYCLTIV